MVESVETNHGFYIGRFEAGNENGILVWNSSVGPGGQTSLTGTWEGTSTLVVKKDKNVWNWIRWGESNTEIGTEGAVYQALNFVKNTYTDKGKEVGVKSTLVYGIQWDAVMRWISKDENLKGYITNSTGKGNYDNDANNPAKTGAVDTYQLKNIYDMAGNVSEWTMEAFTEISEADYRVFRGGNFCSDGSFFTMSYCDWQNGPSISTDIIGFRVALYVEQIFITIIRVLKNNCVNSKSIIFECAVIFIIKVFD